MLYIPEVVVVVATAGAVYQIQQKPSTEDFPSLSTIVSYILSSARRGEVSASQKRSRRNNA